MTGHNFLEYTCEPGVRCANPEPGKKSTIFIALAYEKNSFHSFRNHTGDSRSA